MLDHTPWSDRLCSLSVSLITVICAAVFVALLVSVPEWSHVVGFAVAIETVSVIVLRRWSANQRAQRLASQVTFYSDNGRGPSDSELALVAAVSGKRSPVACRYVPFTVTSDGNCS